jgi:DNA polymerase-3 subunit epsilon
MVKQNLKTNVTTELNVHLLNIKKIGGQNLLSSNNLKSPIRWAFLYRMNLSLKKPLCVIDLEATGLQITTDRIVQIAMLRIDPNGEQHAFNELVNPLMNIPEEIVLIHGITNEMAKKAKTFQELAKDVTEFIGNADLVGYNSNKFDIPLLAEELLRTGIEYNLSDRNFIDVQNIFHKMEQRTLAAAVKFYCNKTLEGAHDAMNDVLATWNVFEAQLNRYAELSKEVPKLAEFSRSHNHEMVDFAGRLARNERSQVIYNFGKHKNKTIEEVSIAEPGYYGWMLEADFPLHTKACLRKEMERIKEKRKNDQEDDQSLEDKLKALKQKFSQG